MSWWVGVPWDQQLDGPIVEAQERWHELNANAGSLLITTCGRPVDTRPRAVGDLRSQPDGPTCPACAGVREGRIRMGAGVP